MQQVHPRLVGLGVSQGEEGRQFEAHSISSITALKTADNYVTVVLLDFYLILTEISKARASLRYFQKGFDSIF